MQRRATILGTGLFAPGEPVDNLVFNRHFKRDDIDTFLKEKRGIHQRHFMSADQATSDLILPAAKQAMQQAGVEADDLSLIIVATDTPDYISPATATVVQHKLGAKRAGAFDVNAACAGFVTALDIGSKYISNDDRCRYVLVVGAYGMSKYLDHDDYKTACLFADGAGAVVLGASDEAGYGVLATQLLSDGQYHEYMGLHAGGTRTPFSADVLAKGDHLLRFRQKIPNDLNGRVWTELTRSLLDRVGRPVSDIDHLFLTQINNDSINEVVANLGLPPGRTHRIMDRYAYTGSACIPMALADVAAKHKLRKGELVVLVASGGGVAVAGVALTWGYDS